MLYMSYYDRLDNIDNSMSHYNRLDIIDSTLFPVHYNRYDNICR